MARARGAHAQHVAAEEQRGRDAEQVAREPLRREAVAFAEERKAAADAEREPDEDARADRFAEQRKGAERDPDRRRGGEEGGVRDARVQDREGPEEKENGREHV